MNSPHINLQDIAQKANAPVEEVAKVILGQSDVAIEIRRRVLKAMKDAGVIKTTEQRGAVATTIGVAVPKLRGDDYIGQVSRSASETLKYLGFSPILINVQDGNWENDLTRLLNEGGCSGMVMVVPNNLNQLVEFCQHYNRPYILVDYQGDEDIGSVPTVEVDNHQGILRVMDYLFELGHRRIGFITGRLDHSSARKRLQGYLDALAEAGIEYDPDLVVQGNWEHALAYEQASRLLRLRSRPSAIVGSNDFSAFGAIQAANEVGLIVGSNLSITGFDDIPLAAGLTTVRQPMQQLGQMAAEMLVECLSGRSVSPLHVQLETELIIRDSTGAAHANHVA
jgi:LacI family transcriptional regulator